MKDIIEKIDILVESPVYGEKKGKAYLNYKKQIDRTKDKRELTVLLIKFEKDLKKNLITNKEMIDLIDKTDLKAIKLGDK